MDSVAKLLRRVSTRDRQRLKDVIERFENNNTAGLRIVKLQGGEVYRIRVGNFRSTDTHPNLFPLRI